MILFGRAKTGSLGLDAHEKVEKTGTTRQRFQHIGHGHLKKKKKWLLQDLGLRHIGRLQAGPLV